MVSVWLFVGFILGILSILALEGLVILLVINKLSQSSKSAQETALVDTPQSPLDPRQSLHSIYQKQGVVWVLEPDILPQVLASEQSKKREIVEVTPIRKVAKVKDRTLILTETDGSLTKVLLKGCQVVAVSATSLPTKKWAKRFPIKVDSKNAVLYHGSKVLYIYAETSWDKESWCRALRIASSDDKERLLWFSKLSEEFHCYLKSLADGYPSLMKPSVGYQGGPLDKINRPEDPPSKVRQFWRKLSRKSSWPIQDEKRTYDKCRAPPDPSSVPGNEQTAVSAKIPAEFGEDSSSASSSASTRSRNSCHTSEISDADAPEKFVVDEGTLCWNLLVSRLFFDVKNNLDIKAALKARIQRTLSNMRTPSYIGEVICTDVNTGNLPPYIHGMRAIPTDMNSLWALEIDIEYCGGAVLYIEARLEVGELDSHNGMVDHDKDSSSVGEVTAVLFEDFKHLQEEMKLSAGSPDTDKTYAQDPKLDKLRSSKIGVSTSTPGSRWKAILNSVAKQVSQVPLTLAIKVAALKGTIQLHVRPPPSDQLWFGFTSMPDIQFQLESSVKDHKIASGRIASFLISRFKASIKETLVLPNCESASLSWMLGEKDDWIPRSAAPLMWLSRESPSDTATSKEMCHSSTRKTKYGDKDLESKQGKHRNIDTMKQPIYEDTEVSSSALRRSSSESNGLPGDLRVPLLLNGEVRDCSTQRREETSESHSPTRYVSLREERNGIEDDDGKPKRIGRRSRMLDLGKKVGEKFEEKRRHIEEKGRHMVEKMRGP